MASLKQFSMAHIFIALIFGFMLIFTTAVRVCHYLGKCMNNRDCFSQCNKESRTTGVCIPDPNSHEKPMRSRCCCL
ncbi:hypothetical protein MKW98_007142 [Papaver atlanticum]|uniref:Uncharacterized protein n=1 Tax=Papaver atlanticum TaxID=357466 RepID=A0AAD4SN22_9MAGN|nr:hypothetical protein MKW98_007142 [Papaver atlanticum]